LSPEISAQLIRAYRNGRDLTDKPRGVFAIDTYEYAEDELRAEAPKIWQWLRDRVKPERDQNPRRNRRENWWRYGEDHPRARRAIAGLPRYIATVMTAKHRVFQFLDSSILPDQKLVVIGLDDAYLLGVLSSIAHVIWATVAGGRLGVGNDPVYGKSACFESFPFPQANHQTVSDIRELGEHLDAHRKRQQAIHPDLTLTGMYNVLETLRSGKALTVKERTIHEQGLVSVVRQLHDELDAAVLDAYGWSDLLTLLRVSHGNESPPTGQTREDAARAFKEAVLERLVALNAERAAEEARGLIRWLRPEFQNRGAQPGPQQTEMDTDTEADDDNSKSTASSTAAKPKPWPKDPVDQVRAVADLLVSSRTSLTVDDITARFSSRGPWKRRVGPLLEMLVALGRATEREGRYIARS
jgi:hypothetical protein